MCIAIVKNIINTHLAYFFCRFFLSIKVETDCYLRHNNCRFDILFQHISNIDSFFYFIFSINNTLYLIDIPFWDVFFLPMFLNKQKRSKSIDCFFFFSIFILAKIPASVQPNDHRIQGTQQVYQHRIQGYHQ